MSRIKTLLEGFIDQNIQEWFTSSNKDITNRWKLDVAIWSALSSLINSLQEMLGVESISLSHVGWIIDGMSRSCHIITCIQIVMKCSLFDLPWTLTMLSCVAQRSPSSTLNLDRYISFDGWLRFIAFYKTNHRPIRVHCVPLLSKRKSTPVFK